MIVRASRRVRILADDGITMVRSDVQTLRTDSIMEHWVRPSGTGCRTGADHKRGLTIVFTGPRDVDSGGTVPLLASPAVDVNSCAISGICSQRG